MATNTWIKVSGVWKEVVSVWEKVGGVWKNNVVPKGNVGGIWKEFKVYTISQLVFDSFDRANDSTTLGTTETGQVWQKYGTPNVWGISNNQAYPVTPSYENPVYVETGVSNVSFKVKIAARTNGTQIFWRIVNATNNYVFENTTVYRVINGAFASMGSIPAPASGDVIRVDLQGNTHTVFVNDVQRLTFSDATHATGTKFGFSTNSTATRLDNFVIEAL